jgi:hypothetical protein
MSKSNVFETSLLNHVFANLPIGTVGDTTGLPAAATAGSLYISLHTADPGEAGDQSTSEATYTGYARVGVVRSSAGWTVASGSVTNAAIINFAACTAGSNTISHVGIGTASTGAGVLLYSLALTASLAVSNGITPSFAISSLTVNED